MFMAMSFVVLALYGLFAAAIRGRVISKPAIMVWMGCRFAGAFVLLGARRAFTEHETMADLSSFPLTKI